MIRTISWLAFVLLFAVPSIALAQEEPVVDATEEEVPEPFQLIGLTLDYQMIEDIPVSDLGLSFEDEPKQGVAVRTVFENTQADADGFLAGDIIFRFDGDEIDSIDELVEAMIITPISGSVVRVLRKVDGKDMVQDLIFHVGTHYTDRVNMLIFNYSSTPYFRHYDVAYYLWQYRTSRYSQFTSFIPILYQYRRVSTRTTHRFFWFLDIQTGRIPEEVDI